MKRKSYSFFIQNEKEILETGKRIKIKIKIKKLVITTSKIIMLGKDETQIFLKDTYLLYVLFFQKTKDNIQDKIT